MAPSFQRCNCLHHPPPPVAAAAAAAAIIRLFIPLETAVLLNIISIARKSCPTACSCLCSRDELCCRPQPQAPPSGPPPTSQAAAFHSLPPTPLFQLPSKPLWLLPLWPFLTSLSCLLATPPLPSCCPSHKVSSTLTGTHTQRFAAELRCVYVRCLL